MAIRRHLIGNRANYSNRLLEKPLSCFPISLLAQHGINQIAIVVDSPIEITPLPMHFDGGFIDIPAFPCLSPPRGFVAGPLSKEQTALPSLG
jgi:hypothetical protein